MGVVKIEGKEITLPDDVIRAGDKAVRAVLAANGFPAVENADIQIVGGERQGAPATATVTPRSTGKGGTGGAFTPARDVLETLLSAPEYLNPAIALASECRRAEAQGDDEFFERARRSGQVERAVSEGQREGRDVLKALKALGHVVPCSSDEVPEGF